MSEEKKAKKTKTEEKAKAEFVTMFNKAIRPRYGPSQT